MVFVPSTAKTTSTQQQATTPKAPDKAEQQPQPATTDYGPKVDEIRHLLSILLEAVDDNAGEHTGMTNNTGHAKTTSDPLYMGDEDDLVKRVLSQLSAEDNKASAPALSPPDEAGSIYENIFD